MDARDPVTATAEDRCPRCGAHFILVVEADNKPHLFRCRRCKYPMEGKFHTPDRRKPRRI